MKIESTLESILLQSFEAEVGLRKVSTLGAALCVESEPKKSKDGNIPRSALYGVSEKGRKGVCVLGQLRVEVQSPTGSNEIFTWTSNLV